MKADLKDVIASVFEPLANASGRPDLLPKLKTEDLAPEIRKLQFDRFKTVKLRGTNVAHLPGGGFLCLYEHLSGRYLAFTMPRLNEADDATVSQWGDDLGFQQEELDQSTFLFLCHELKGFFSIRSQYRRSQDALDVIDVIAVDYKGHLFDDLYNLYEQVYIFKVPKNNSMYSEGISSYGFMLCSAFTGARSAIITQEVNSTLRGLGTHSVVSKDNLFQALTSTQWRHFFIEVYRCLESIYYFPWVLELRATAGFDVPIAALKAHCRASLNWREREEPSIMKIFGSVAPDQDTITLEKAIKRFKQHTKNKTFKRDTIGREVYHIRNSLVHHEDYENPDKMLLTGKEWEEISLYLSKILLKYVGDHTHEFSTNQ
jgi:hypothetical protein